MSIEAMKLALEALYMSDMVFYPQTKIAIAAVEEAIEQAQKQEPVACDCKQGQSCHVCDPFFPFDSAPQTKMQKDVAIGVDVTENGTHVTAIRMRPDGINVVIYSQFHPLVQKQEPVAHWSDCAVHSEPAYPKGACDCGGWTHDRAVFETARNFYNMTVADSGVRISTPSQKKRDDVTKAGEALRLAILSKLKADTSPPQRQPEQAQKQEPVGEAYLCDACHTPFDGAYECPSCGHNEATKEPVYTSPPQRQPDAKDFDAYCKTLHPLWNTGISRAEAEGFFQAGWLAAHGIKGEV